MANARRNKEREERINMEIIVDAYTPEEQDLAWYSYLSSALQFPFAARCTTFRLISPLEPGKKVEVLEMAPEEECNSEIFVVIRWQKRELGVPLMQLKCTDDDEETQQAIEDWRYWFNQHRGDEEEGDEDDGEYEDDDE